MERLDALPEAADAANDAGEDDDEASAGPIAIAVDMTEGEGADTTPAGDKPAP